jgi:hypothetical protein
MSRSIVLLSDGSGILICFDLTALRGARFSPPLDVLPFFPLTYLTQTIHVRLVQNQ